MDAYPEIAKRIIEEQEAIIGPVAIEQAEQVPGLDLDWANRHVVVTGPGKQVINQLVLQYTSLFGQASVEVCKEAASKITSRLSPEQLPESLR